MTDLLLIDDEPAIRHAFRKAFGQSGYQIRTVGSCAEAIRELNQKAATVIVLDVHLPDANGLETYQALRKIDARVPIILITGHGTTELAIEAMKHGAFDYLGKPLELPALREQIDRAIRSSLLMRTPTVLPQEPPNDSGDQLVGQCHAMQEVYKSIGRVAGQDVAVLIRGESGTGKELVARAIYQHGRRATKPFHAINCGAIPENLIESELFGHERGSFTGADRKRIGKFEQCDGGTLFLDEIGDMPTLAQVKLLRVLQEQQFERVGGTETVKVNVHVIAATNADLDVMTGDGRFRTDLFFRLNGYSISLPPLRERGEDLPHLIEHFLRRFEREMGKPRTELPEESLAVLMAYPWPGNVRELQSVLKQSLLQMSGQVLLVDYLPAQLTNRGAPTTPKVSSEAFDWNQFVDERIEAGSETIYAEALVRMEREVLVRVLRQTQGNQLQAARRLGMTRGSLRTKVRALGITISRDIWSESDQSE